MGRLTSNLPFIAYFKNLKHEFKLPSSKLYTKCMFPRFLQFSNLGQGNLELRKHFKGNCLLDYLIVVIFSHSPVTEGG